MRRVVALIALLVLAPGCFVFDELDKGQEILEKHSPKRAEQKEKEAASRPASASSATGKEEPGLIDQVRSWIAQRTAEAQPERPQADPDDVPVSCRIDGHLRFVRKSDCQLRGGQML
jgi:hypothetical protein